VKGYVTKLTIWISTDGRKEKEIQEQMKKMIEYITNELEVGIRIDEVYPLNRSPSWVIPPGKSQASRSYVPLSEAGPRNKSKRRQCMTCERYFISTGNHHRMCKECRGKSTNPYEPDP